MASRKRDQSRTVSLPFKLTDAEALEFAHFLKRRGLGNCKVIYAPYKANKSAVHSSSKDCAKGACVIKPTFRFSQNERREIESAFFKDHFDSHLIPDFIRALELETDMLQFRVFADRPAKGPGRPSREYERDFATRVAWLFSDHLGLAPKTAHDEHSSSFASVIGICLHAVKLRVPKDPFKLIRPGVRAVAPIPTSGVYLTSAERNAIKGNNRNTTRSRRKKPKPKAIRRTAN